MSKKKKKEKKPEVDIELSIEEKALLLKELVHDTKKDLMAAIVQEAIFQIEFHTPTHITKTEAEQNMGTYQTRIKHLKANIFAYEGYTNAHGIEI